MINLLRLMSALAVGFAVMQTTAFAHGPTPQKVEEKIEIAVPPEKVWEIAGDFARICEWHTGIAKCEAAGGNASGGTRTLTLQNGGVISEGVDDYNVAEKQVSYRLSKENLEALPVSFYSATLSVKAAGAGSEVTWVGRFYRGDTSNFPPDNLNDEAAVKAMTEFFHKGLEGLKAKLEGKG